MTAVLSVADRFRTGGHVILFRLRTRWPAGVEPLAGAGAFGLGLGSPAGPVAGRPGFGAVSSWGPS
ncbi:hypothetical protein [Streptomyces sp. NPDC127039]|uniref:hypothetical protein n=1 Tax=Streptomyces sp. NPDC127039 TaxID=3347115 RepID=UPI00365CD953